jgi:hypothetical protein
MYIVPLCPCGKEVFLFNIKNSFGNKIKEGGEKWLK